MADRHWYQKLQSLLVGHTRISGSFRPNGATGIVSGSFKRRHGYNVARTSAGLYTVTLDDQYAKLVAANASVRVADATPTVVQIGDYSATNKTLQLRVLQAATGAIPSGPVPIDISSARNLQSNDIPQLTDNEATATYASGGYLAKDTTPIYERVNGATDKAQRIHWAAADVSEITLPPIPKPADLDASSDVTVHLMIAKGTNTDTSAVIDVQAFDGVGDTEMGGNTAALATDALTEYTVTLANADIAAAPGFINLALIPGAHANDAIYLYSMWLEYTRTGFTSQVWSLTDLAADVDNVVNFDLVMSTSTVD